MATNAKEKKSDSGKKAKDSAKETADAKKKELEKKAREIAKKLESGEASSGNVRKKAQEIAKKLVGENVLDLKAAVTGKPSRKVEIKPLEEVEKEIEREAAAAGPEEKPLVRAVPKEKPPVKVKGIEQVQQEIEREKRRQEELKETAKTYPFLEGVKKARERAKKRKFSQTWDLAINLKGLDLKKPENRFNLDYPLPAGRGKDARVGVIVDSLAAEAAKEGAEAIVRKEEIPALAKDIKKLKKLADSVDWLFGEVTLMAQVGKSFGATLGPRGKVPRPLPPKNAGVFIRRARKAVRVMVKDSPVIHVPVGMEKMSEEDVVKNIEGVVGFVKENLPKGMNNIRSMYLKLTMGKPVKLEVK